MNGDYNYNIGYILNGVIFGEEGLDKFDEFLKIYGDKSDEYLYEEIKKIQAEVPTEVKRMHLKNLEHLTQMEGFITDEIKEKIQKIRKLLQIDNASTPPRRRRYNVQFYFFNGSSLLLWFLILVVLFRRRPFRRPFFGPFFGY